MQGSLIDSLLTRPVPLRWGTIFKAQPGVSALPIGPALCLTSGSRALCRVAACSENSCEESDRIRPRAGMQVAPEFRVDPTCNLEDWSGAREMSPHDQLPSEWPETLAEFRACEDLNRRVPCG